MKIKLTKQISKLITDIVGYQIIESLEYFYNEANDDQHISYIVGTKHITEFTFNFSLNELTVIEFFNSWGNYKKEKCFYYNETKILDLFLMLGMELEHQRTKEVFEIIKHKLVLEFL